MYKLFTDLNSLFSYIKEDKEWDGAEASHRNRYPIRFILFDNFADFNDFVNERPDGIFTFSLNKIVDPDYPDISPTFTELSTKIREFIKFQPASDYIIYPFSEMTRFYPSAEFQSLVKTIKAINPPAEGQRDHLRIYIPIVGMQGKMSAFMEDNHTYVWEYKSPNESGIYNLILSKGTTYGISSLEQNFSIVHNLCQWLQLWEKGDNVKPNIICTSPTIFTCANNAQPDNAFHYTECTNAFEFLTKGLGLDFDGIRYNDDEAGYWEQLAAIIDADHFDCQQFINERFDSNSLHSSADFIKTWFECETDFDRWLLAIYFLKVSEGKGYIGRVLADCANLSSAELFSVIATKIFDTNPTDNDVRERNLALKEAQRHNVKLTDYAEKKVCAKLSAMLCGEPQVEYVAKRLITSLTDGERRLIIELLGRGVIDRKDIEKTFPQLFNYTAPLSVQLPQNSQWISQYCDAYRLAKIQNNAQAALPLLLEKNANSATFRQWFDQIKTVKTILHNRTDIDIIYWIDGLGIDWIPFITAIIQKHSRENVYLNEIYIARAILPTTTSVNKAKLLELVADGNLKKIGDLDSFAHQYKAPYPQYLIEEMNIVEEAISNILAQYNGKKIAFVSDHGMSYLAQYGKGLSLAGVESNHEGRVATCTSANAVSDSKYVILEDGKTLCALTYNSLTAKTPQGHGAHGGATPEEVLVPIIIVSNQPNPCTYSVDIIDKDVQGNNPVVRFNIRGLNSIDTPLVEYNNVTYSLFNEDRNTFVSEKLNLVDTAIRVTVLIGNFKKSFTINISTGATEDADLFEF